MTCDVASLIASNSSSKFYVINSKLFSHYVRLHVSFLNKFLSRWQLLMDWCFEGGLHQAWDTFENDEKYFKEDEEKVEDILGFDDFISAVRLSFPGLILAGIVLILEVFWHDFVKQFYKRWKEKLRNLRLGRDENGKLRVRRWKKIQRVRRIQVRPIEN